MGYDRAIIESTIASALEADEIPEGKRQDIAFHMADWLGDLEAWHSFCREPGALDAEQLSQLLIRFLNHVPNHVVAAKKLYLGEPTEDIFGIGVFEED